MNHRHDSREPEDDFGSNKSHPLGSLENPAIFRKTAHMVHIYGQGGLNVENVSIVGTSVYALCRAESRNPENRVLALTREGAEDLLNKLRIALS